MFDQTTRTFVLALSIALLTVAFPAGADGTVASDGTCTPHPPIRIDGDRPGLGFTLGPNPANGEPIYRPGSGVIAGTGTADDPFVIAGWCIAPGTAGLKGAGLLVENTDAHLVVRNNTMQLAGENVNLQRGFQLFDTENVRVVGNELVGLSDSIEVEDSPGIVVADNRIEGALVGIDADRSDGVVVEDNRIQDTFRGFVTIAADESDDVRIANNTLTNAGAIVVDGRSRSLMTAVVEDNVVEASGLGLLVEQAEVRAENNRFVDNADEGLLVRSSGTVEAVDNVLAGNEVGVGVGENGEARIQGNNIHANEQAGLDATEASGLVDARGNWWGAASGPSGGIESGCTDAIADGAGQAILAENGIVCFEDWLTQPNPDAGVSGN